ncbi:MAG TPA: DUF4157 domain-containing protein [Candidatus Angelobacter sp.]|nr:DUF4157 domain-containing protein [Candidatus Angelobacter sp.]
MNHGALVRKPAVSVGDKHAGSKAASSSLFIGEPNDSFEQEADRVAQHVMESGGTRLNWSFSKVNTGVPLQRQCSCGSSGGQGECEECKQRKLQRQSKEIAGPATAPRVVHEVLRSSGQPLDKQTRAYFEPRFGHDFSKVRIHTDAQAAESARAVNALAYTVGGDVIFGAGRFAPMTNSGRQLLAHELTHVVQQGAGNTLPGRADLSPNEFVNMQASPVMKPVLSSSKSPQFLHASRKLQRQPVDKLGIEREPSPDPKTERANQACGKPCGNFPWVEVAPDVFVILCDDTVKMNPAVVTTTGCTPGRLGTVHFVSGSPAWMMPTKCDTCVVSVNNKPTGNPAGIKVGYIQTVEKSLSGGVYYKRDASNKWVWAGNDWVCATQARDGFSNSTAPWYGPGPDGKFGPQPFGTCPELGDNPRVKLPSGQNVKNKAGVDRPQWPLRWMRIDGVFHTWLVAQSPKGAVTFIHHWSFQCYATAELTQDDADPCNTSQWKMVTNNKLISSGTGKGSATPALTGGVAGDLKKKC